MSILHLLHLYNDFHLLLKAIIYLLRLIPFFILEVTIILTTKNVKASKKAKAHAAIRVGL
jgi:ABC-type methionine transport system permease subunit